MARQVHNWPMRFFNTDGPVRPDKHYAIPPLERVNVGEILGLMRRVSRRTRGSGS